MKEKSMEELKQDIEWLNNKRIKNTRLNQGILKIFTDILGYGQTAEIVKYIVDNETDQEIVNAAKYIMYWVERENICDFPEFNKYNNYNKKMYE